MVIRVALKRLFEQEPGKLQVIKRYSQHSIDLGVRWFFLLALGGCILNPPLERFLSLRFVIRYFITFELLLYDEVTWDSIQ